MSTIRPTLGQDYTTQLPTSTTGVDTTAPTGTVTGTSGAPALDGVDAPAGRGASTSPLGQPRVTGGTSYDPTLGDTTLGDVSTVNGIVGGSSSSDLDALLAKLLIAFNGTDKDSTDTLLQAADDRQKADQSQEANKAVQLAELMDAANSGDCMARQRTEQKLEEMGYSPDQAQEIAKQMTGKNTSPGQQAILALAAVDNAPGSSKLGTAEAGASAPAGAGTTYDPIGVNDDPGSVQQKAQQQQAENEVKLLLLAMLLSSRSRGMDGGLAATGKGGGTGTAGADPTQGIGTTQPPGMSIT